MINYRKSYFKKLIFSAVGLIPTSILMRLAKLDVLLPYHHLVSDSYAPHISPLYDFKNVKEFKKDLDYLLRYFSPISPIDIVDALVHSKPIPKNSFLLTFDDGLREVYDTVAPILKEKGLPAVFFLNSDFIDNRKLFYRFKAGLIIDKILSGAVSQAKQEEIEYLIEGELGYLRGSVIDKIKVIDYHSKSILSEIATTVGVSYSDFLESYKPYLTSDQIIKLSRDGFYFGAHSIDHPNYELIDINHQLYQTIESANFVNNRYNFEHNFFAFPHLDKSVSEKFFDIISGRDIGRFDLIFGNCNQKKDKYPNILHRFNSENPQFDINTLVSSVLLYTCFNKLLGRTYVRRAKKNKNVQVH